MELKDHTDQFEQFLVVTREARSSSERDRDYRDHKQWTEDDVNTLKARNQAPVVINRVKTKVNLLNGVQRQRRTDPKALPRTPQHEKDADSVTEALRFVADNNDIEHLSSDVFDDIVVWGYGGTIVEVVPGKNGFEVELNQIQSDRFYFDPFSRRLDFKDARFLGIVVWMDEDEAKETFPGKANEIDNLLSTDLDSMDSTFEDKPAWVDRKSRRIRVCQHYYRDRGEWKLAYFTQHVYLIEPRPSPYHDEDGVPTCPIEAQAAYIDRDNNRYGEVRAYIWAQDEINHRRSKALYQLSVRQTAGEEGAVDADEVKRELARPDGHVNIKIREGRFEILDTNDMTQGQLALYEDAKNDIDAIGANAALSGTQEQAMSGRAIQALQQGGIAELEALFDGHAYWEKRVYRQIWARIKQFWNEERWIRVTDNEDNLRWVTLNQQVTVGEVLQERAQQGDHQAQKMLQQMINDPRLNQVAEVRNNTTELEVDVILTKSPDYATVRQEQFETMARLAQSYGPEAVPFEAMLRLSDMTNKDEVMEILKPQEEEIDPEQQQAQQQLAAQLAELEFRQKAAEVEKKEREVLELEAEIRKEAADTEAQEIENAVVNSQLESGDMSRFKRISTTTGA